MERGGRRLGRGTITWRLHSTAFGAGEAIPPEFTCDGVDHSPPLSWEEPPSGARSLALIVEDPGAPGGTFAHWVLFNLPTNLRGLDAAIPTDTELLQGAVQGSNGSGDVGYVGPCRPPGSAHRYVFHLYALDQPLHLAAGASRDEVATAMRGRIVGEAELVGRYGRPPDVQARDQRGAASAAPTPAAGAGQGLVQGFVCRKCGANSRWMGRWMSITAPSTTGAEAPGAYHDEERRAPMDRTSTTGRRAAIYARATGDEADQPSIEEQKAACQRYAEANGYWVTQYVVELPDTEGPRDYPERERLIRAMRANPLDAVIVTSLDRLSRDPAELGAIREQADLGGVQLISLDGQESR